MRPPRELDQFEKAARLLEALHQGERITAERIEKLCHVSYASAKRYMGALERSVPGVKVNEIEVNAPYPKRELWLPREQERQPSRGWER